MTTTTHRHQLRTATPTNTSHRETARTLASQLFSYEDRISYLAMRELDTFYQQVPPNAPCQSQPMDAELYACILSTIRLECALDLRDPGM